MSMSAVTMMWMTSLVTIKSTNSLKGVSAYRPRKKNNRNTIHYDSKWRHRVIRLEVHPKQVAAESAWDFLAYWQRQAQMYNQLRLRKTLILQAEKIRPFKDHQQYWHGLVLAHTTTQWCCHPPTRIWILSNASSIHLTTLAINAARAALLSQKTATSFPASKHEKTLQTNKHRKRL